MLFKLKPSIQYGTYLYTCLSPLIFSLFFERQREEDFVFSFLSSLLFLIPLYFIKNPKWYFIPSSFLLWVTGLFDIVHISLYQGRVTSSIFFIILDTNPMESYEFISSNISLGLCFVVLFYSSIFFTLMIKAINSENHLYGKGFRIKSLFFIFVPLLVKFFGSSMNISKTLEPYIRSNQAFLMIDTFLDYNKEMKILTDFSKRSKEVKNVKRSKENLGPETHILVIGESMTRNHMSLYGYRRNTTPLLNKRKEDLIVFEDVANSHPPSTASSLKKINTLANTKDYSAEALSISLINIMKAAKFRTYWISNQLLLGSHDTVTTALAKQADVHVFTNTTNSITYDEKLLPIFGKKLAEPPRKKFIVIHLIGAHMKYRNRYPKDYNHFVGDKGIVKKKFHNKKKIQYINEYDNAVLYQDYILDSILNYVEKLDGVSSLLFLSDHGEEVYRDKDLHGHPSVDTVSLYEIPMMIWLSKDYKAKLKNTSARIQNSIKKPFSQDDIIHSLMDMYGVSYSKYRKELNMFSSEFKPKKRYIDKLRDKKKKALGK